MNRSRWFCEICDKEIAKRNKHNHLNTKAHCSKDPSREPPMWFCKDCCVNVLYVSLNNHRKSVKHLIAIGDLESAQAKKSFYCEVCDKHLLAASKPYHLKSRCHKISLETGISLKERVSTQRLKKRLRIHRKEVVKHTEQLKKLGVLFR